MILESLYLEVTVGSTLIAVQRLGPSKEIHADGVYTSVTRRQKEEAIRAYYIAEGAILRRCDPQDRWSKGQRIGRQA